MSDDFTVKNLIEWLESKPAGRSYNWTTAGSCLLGQWCGSKGMTGKARREKSVSLGRDDWFYQIALCYPYTFGDALQRARSLALPSDQRQTGE